MELLSPYRNTIQDPVGAAKAEREREPPPQELGLFSPMPPGYSLLLSGEVPFILLCS